VTLGSRLCAEEESQLSTYRRIRLYIRNPKDAFSIISAREQRIDAVWIFVLYFLIKAPVLLQKYAAHGRLSQFTVGVWASVMAVAMMAGVVLTLLTALVFGLLLHLLVNVALRAGRSFAEAVRFLVLCMAPELLLVGEYPALILGFTEYETFLVFLALRLVAGVLVFRTFYWGLRKYFGLSRGWAAGVVAVPIAVTAGLSALFIAAAMKSVS
jgi:hypothetical protein